VKKPKADGDELGNAFHSNIIYPISSAYTTCAAYPDHLALLHLAAN